MNQNRQPKGAPTGGQFAPSVNLESSVELSEVVVKRINGGDFWYLNGELHRTDGPAIENGASGNHWYLNGRRHREDGPAVECEDGSKEWYLNGRRHREDGPAIESSDGYLGWYLDGEPITEAEFNSIKQES